MTIDPAEFLRIAERLMRCPAAPYCEGGVAAAIDQMAAEFGIAHATDRVGNRYWTLSTDPAAAPLVLAAHMDHPAFKFLAAPALGQPRLAKFLGGVPPEYFKPGLPLRAMPGAIPARLGRATAEKAVYEIELEGDLTPEFAVWELPDFQLSEGRIHGRACDDLIGVAVIIAVLAGLKREGARVHVIGVLSRAEEVGFQGALLAAKSGLIPRESLVVSLETSRELPLAKMGAGMIVRVGDRASVFDHKATCFLGEVAADLAKADATFQFQRALMNGGTCEGTAYQELGYRTAAVCVALGNYHNCAENGTIAAEYVDLRDACGMAQLLQAAALSMRDFSQLTDRLPQRLRDLTQQAETALAVPL